MWLCEEKYFLKLHSQRVNGSTYVQKNEDVELVQACRKQSLLFVDERWDIKLQELFKRYIESEIHVRKTCETRFCRLIGEADVPVDDVPVCKKAFAFANGYSVTYLERTSERFKETGSRTLDSTKNKNFSDKSLHDNIYNQTEQMMQHNLKSLNVG